METYFIFYQYEFQHITKRKLRDNSIARDLFQNIIMGIYVYIKYVSIDKVHSINRISGFGMNERTDD